MRTLEEEYEYRAQRDKNMYRTAGMDRLNRGLNQPRHKTALWWIGGMMTLLMLTLIASMVMAL